MRISPTFTRDELAEAFSLIIAAPPAQHWAGEWFARFGSDEDVDETGRYLYEHRGAEDVRRSVVVHGVGAPTASTGLTGYEEYSHQSDDEIGEFLMHFSDFHLNLASLVSPDLSERVRIARGDTPERHEHRKAQMRRIVASMRPRAT